MSITTSIVAERHEVECGEAKPILFMLSVAAAPLQTPAEKGVSKAQISGDGVRVPRPPPGPKSTAQPSSAVAAPPSPHQEPPSTSSSAASDVCSLEGCGLRWRVRPPLQRRSAWTVAAQRMRLCIEALGGAKVEKVYTLLDHHELAPCISYEVCIGDLHAGDSIHVPVLIWLPALSGATSVMEAVRFSLQYVDAVKIDTMSAELTASVSRPAPGEAAQLTPSPPVALDRERNRVLVAEAMQRAAMVANNGNLDAACLLLAETSSMLSMSPSALARDPLSLRLLEGASSALRKLDEVVADLKTRNGGGSASLLDKHANGASNASAQGGWSPAGGSSSHQSALTRTDGSGPSQSPSPLVNVLLGSTVSPTDGRAPLKPRTFSVSLPFSSLGAGAARADGPNPSATQHLGSLAEHASSSSSNAPHGYSWGAVGNLAATGGAGGAASLSIGGVGSGGQTSLLRRSLLQLRDSSAEAAGGASSSTAYGQQQDGAAGAAAADPFLGGAGGPGGNALREAASLRSSGLLPKAPPLRLLSGAVVGFANAKRSGRAGGALRGRPRLLMPPVLMPLHAPPSVGPNLSAGGALTGPNGQPPLGIGTTPLPPAGSGMVSKLESYESWLCRLLRTPLRPLPLPDELIAHIFSFLEPSVLFHDSLTLPSLIVDKCTSTTRGHYTTISAALRAASPGDRLLIKPGVYRESLRIDVPVMLLGCPASGSTGGMGNGAAGSSAGSGVTITSSRNHTVHSTAAFARMENITLRQTGSSGRSCLLVSRGRIDVSDCDISSSSGLCVEVTDAAAPTVRHSRVHGGAAAGLWFRAGGGGTVEGNEIWGNGWSGVQISDESDPVLLRNYIHDNKSAGIISFNHGKGVARHNDITSNGKGGVQVRSRASPELVCNRIFAERSFGVWVYEHGLGRFEDNDIVNNAWSGFQVEEGSAPNVIGNRLRGNRSAGIVVYNRGSGTYEWNDISCNGRCGVQIKSGSAPTFRHNRIHHEKQAGVLTAEDGTGVLEDNDIFDNQWSGVQTEGPSNPLLRHNRIHHNGGAGFIAYQNGSGLLEANNIYGNKKYGVQSKTGGHPTVRLNRIHDKVYGIYLTESGGGVYEENRIHNIRGTGIYVSSDCSPVLSNNQGVP